MEEIKYSGKIIEVVQYKYGNRVFEKARRSPGVRALIVLGNKILLSKEYREELHDYDYRLPGGKVFDTLEEYKNHTKEDLSEYAKKAVIKEVKEEVGLLAKNPTLLKVSKAGATVEWDLFYFEIKDFTKNKNGQELEEGEDITFDWYSFEDVKKLCRIQRISEDRSVGVLLNYILTKQEIHKER